MVAPRYPNIGFLPCVNNCCAFSFNIMGSNSKESLRNVLIHFDDDCKDAACLYNLLMITECYFDDGVPA